MSINQLATLSSSSMCVYLSAIIMMYTHILLRSKVIVSRSDWESWEIPEHSSVCVRPVYFNCVYAWSLSLVFPCHRLMVAPVNISTTHIWTCQLVDWAVKADNSICTGSVYWLFLRASSAMREYVLNETHPNFHSHLKCACEQVFETNFPIQFWFTKSWFDSH